MNKSLFSSRATRYFWIHSSIFGAGILFVLVTALLMLGSPTTQLKTAAAPVSAMSAVDDEAVDVAGPKPDTAWWAEVQAEIGQAEYSITWQEDTRLPNQTAAYQAPNRAHNFRSYFTEAGIQLQPRTEAVDDWQWALNLTGLGYANNVQPVSPAELAPTGNRIAYHRPGITEWYVNDEKGLEQGFTLHQPPASSQRESPDHPLVLELTMAGDLLPERVDDGAAISFKTAEGTAVLRYSDLVVVDANEQVLPAAMQLAGCDGETTTASCQIQLVIDDSQAQYPLIVDPLLTTPDWTAESDQQTALFGSAVAGAGDVNGDGYDDVIVGAYGYDNGQTDEGRAFVFYGSATGLSASADWTAESDQAYANFGISVSSAGDVNGDGYDDVVIGATRYDNGQMDEGRAFVFHGSAAGLSATADWTAEGDKVLAYFGSVVSTAGDVNNDGYDDVIIGASQYYNNFDLFEGWAFVYHGSAAGLSATADWSAEGAQTYAYFGSAVSTAGDVNGDGYDDVIVGAYGYSNGQSSEGRTFVYHGSATGLSTTADWTAESDQASASFGIAVDTAGDVNGDGYNDVIIGAYGYDNGQTDEGRAFVYRGSATGLSASAAWTAESDQASARLGNAVGTAGDVNGDGYNDVIIGAYFYDNGQTDEGQAYAFYGSASGLSATADWTVESDQANADFGISVGTAGDVNGDGADDVIVGASFYDNGQSDEGRAYVFLGSGSGPAAPSADFSASPLTGTVPLTVTFSNLSQNSDSYRWQFGDGITSTQTAPVHSYSQTGTYTVTLTASGSGGPPSTLTRTNYITVTAAPVIADFSASPLTGTVPLTVTFTNASSGATGYAWQFGDGVTSAETSPSHTYSQTGVYTVSLTATGPGGEDTETKQDYITVTDVAPVQADFSAAPISGKAPLTVTFSDNSTGDITTYDWDFGDGGQATEANPTHIYIASGVYTVTLTVTDSDETQDTLVRPSYIFIDPVTVVTPNQTPIITITTPSPGAVIGSYNVQVSGNVADSDGSVQSVQVNGVAASRNGSTFSANITLDGGSQTIQAIAEDNEGAMGFDSIVVSVDDEGPIIDIHSPQDRQAVYALNPTVAISYTDFLDAVNTSSVMVQVTDENNTTTDVTNDLTISANGAAGTLSTALTADISYTLTVTAADTLGNSNSASATFYVPVNPGSITLPEEPADAGWASGVVYDSSTCNEHLTTCQGLSGVQVTFSYAGSITDTITGTVVTGPDGFFAFPFVATDVYWLRAEKEGFTYGQREVAVVKEHSTAVNEIYLTPLDSAATLCTDSGCSHTSSDGNMQVIIPPDAIGAGETITVTATQFDRVYFLPSGELPPGTWETYAFNLGGDSDYAFQKPITVTISNTLGFEPGTQIPLGYWNQSTLQWEHEGLATVDDTGDWVVMHVSHFSNHDPNYPTIPSGIEINSEAWTCEDGSCPAGTPGCFIDAQSGTLQEWIDLPRLNVLGEDVKPQLRYSSARANPSALIDVQIDVDLSGAVTADYLQWELYIEGEKTDNFTIEADLSSNGEVGRYRFFWDGRNSQGQRLPAGVYNYAIRVRIPFEGEYCGPVGGIFGNPPDCEKYPTGRYVTATEEKWVYGTATLEGTPDTSLGAGWLLAGQQRLYEDEAGNILVADANKQVEYYSVLADELDGRGQYSDVQPQTLGPAAAVPTLPLPTSGTNVSGTIASDTTWTAVQSPYIVTDVVTVTDGVTLTIEPGVQVMLAQYQSLVVEGGISAVGTETQPITFTAYSDGPFISWEKYSGTTFDMPVQSIAVDANDDIWFAGFYDDGSGNTAGVVQQLSADLMIWSSFYMPGTVAASQVYEMAIDSLGQKWIGTDDGVVMLDASASWTHYQAGSSGLASDFVYAVAVDGSDNIWLGTDSGVSKLSAGNWTTYTTADGLASNTVYALATGNDGSIWFGTASGLSRLAPDDTWTTYDTSNSGILSNTVEDLAVDGDNNVWMTNPNNGLSVSLAAGGWMTYTPDNSGLASPYVRSIAVDSSGRKWIGYDMAGATVLAPDNSEWNYETTPRLSGDTVVDITPAPSGDVWLAHGSSGATRSYGGAGITADGTIRSGYWDTIQIGGGNNLNDSDDSELSYVIIEAGGAGDQASLFINQSAPALDNLRVWGSGDHGIAVSGSAGFSLSDSIITANRKDGIHIESNSGGHTLNNLTVQGNNGHGIYLGHPGAVFITGVTIADSRGHGVFTENSNNALSLTNSTIRGNGVAARLAVNVTLTNNQWLDNEAQQIEWLGGTLSASRTWTDEVDAYIILGAIDVPDGLSLTLSPGLTLLFAKPTAALNVDGILLASGTLEASIYLGPTADLSSKWGGVDLGGGTSGDSDNSHLAYVVFQGATIGLFIDSSTPTLEYLTFLDNGIGLRASNSSGLVVSNSNFSGNVNYGLENTTTSQPVTAVNNYWGGGGPHHATQYPTNTGEEISDGVVVEPWRATPVPLDGVDTFVASRTEADHTTLVYDPGAGAYTRYYPDGGEIHFDALSRHDYTLYPDGRILSYTYNADGTTASMNITAPGESTPDWTWTFSYTGGTLDYITDPAGRVTDFTINGHGQLAAVAYPDSSGESFAYDARSLLTQHTDPNGDVTGYAYDGYGRLQTDTGPTRAVYDPDTGQVGAAAEVRSFTPSETAYPLLNDSVVGDPDYPAPAVLTSTMLVDEIAYGRGGLSGHTNRWGSWTDVSDATGRFTQYERDKANNILGQTYPSGDCDRFTYDANGNPLTASRMSAADCARETPLNAQTVTMTYEPRFNQVKTITDPDGNTTTYFYDYEVDPDDGLLTDDHLLARIAYPPVNDETGQVVTPTTQYTYNSWGLLATETDAAGKVTRYVYTQVNDTGLFLTGVTPVPGLLTQVIEGDGTANPLVTTYRDFNAQGYAETVIQPGGTDITSYEYDEMGRVISQTNAIGTTTLYEYDTQGNLARRVDDYTADGVSGFNIVTRYNYDADDQIVHQEQTADGLATFADYVADINGNPAQQQDELGYGTTSLYDDADRLVNSIDALGHTITYTYDVNGRVETVTDPDGAVNHTEYDGFNRVERSISNWVDGVYNADYPEEDIVTSYQYDDRNNTIVVTDTLGRMTRTFYDDLNRVTGSIANWTPGTALADCATLPVVRDHDVCTQYAYDELGRTLIVTDTLGRMNRTFYDGMGRVEASVANWNPATLSTPDDCVLSPTNESEENICTLYGYDPAGRQITTTNGLDQTSLNVYDAAGRPIVSVANWDGVTEIADASDCYFPPLQPDVNVCSVTVYDALNRRVQTQDALGHVTDFAYDGLGRVVTTTRYLADGTPVVNVSHYDARGQTYAQTNAAGHTTNTVFDELGRVVSSISAMGVASSQTYDAAGYVIATIDALDHTTTSDYDALGRLITTTNPLNQATVYHYDGLGNQVSVVDAEGVATHYEYDGLNRRTAVIENWDGAAACQLATGSADTNVCTQTTFDALGNQVSVVNARGYTNTHTVYDSLNRVILVEDALGNQTRTQYNALGYRTIVTDANDAVTRYFYDGLNRLTQISYETDGETVTYAYDALGNRTVMTDSLGVTAYEYDDLSRLITVTSPLTGTLVYGYDLMGNRARLTYPGNKVVTYTYNAGSQMTHVFDWDGGVTSYTYDAAGRLAATGLPNGVQTTNSYDAANRLTGLRHVDANTGILQAEYLYELDGLGNRQVVTETMRLPDGTGLDQQSIVYDYDSLYRMTEAAYTGVLSGTYTYQYDAVGNRIYHSNNVTTTETISYTYDAANRLVESVDLTTSKVTTYDWDDASRLITTTVGSNVTRVYQYSQDGDLLQADVDGLVATFAYDGNGQRLQLSIAGEATTFLPDYSGRSNRVLFEKGATETKQYLYGVACLGEYVTDNATSESEWRYYQRDGATLVRQTTNQTATITLAWTFSPEGGVVLGEEGPVTHLGCQDDAVYDWSTGLIFKSGRYFDPSLGIWLVGPGLIIWSTWQPRKRRKGRKGNKSKGQTFILLVVLLLVTIPLTGCEQPDLPPACPTPEATTPPGLPPETPGLPDPTDEPIPTETPEPTPTQPSTPTPTQPPSPTPTQPPSPPPTHTPTPQPPTPPPNIEWLPGLPQYNDKWWITHYYIPMESDPYYADEPEIQARGLPPDKRYKEQFIHDTYYQGTGFTKDGQYITVDDAKTQPGLGYLKFGKGKPSAIPWYTVASRDSRLPRGGTSIIIEVYQHKGTFHVEDEGRELGESQVDVFVGEMTQAEVTALGAYFSRVGIVK